MKITLTFADSVIPEYINLLLRRYNHKRITNDSDTEAFKKLCHEAVHLELMRQMKSERKK